MSRSELKTGPSNANQSTRKLMKMLEVMSQSVGAMRLYDIAEQCEMNPTTTLRFLTTLQSMGYVTQNTKNSRYSLTHKICRVGNLLVAGRCISGDEIAHCAFRSIVACFATGQGAGVAAAVSVLENTTAQNVKIADVQSALMSQKVRVF